jgi:transposase-like protein
MRNGTRSKTVLTEIGPVEIEVPRDRDGSFEPVIVPKRKRRLDGIDQIVLSLSARGLTTGEIAAHFEGGLRGQGLQRHHQPHHGEGRRGTGRVVGPTFGSGLSGALR